MPNDLILYVKYHLFHLSVTVRFMCCPTAKTLFTFMFNSCILLKSCNLLQLSANWQIHAKAQNFTIE